ncbi:MAG: dihydropteroate synthase [Smithellaceae bacterium]|nr:dihydropteroate synthase [Smithellaceae bacterium]
MRWLHLPERSEALAVLRAVDVDPYGIEAMLPKMSMANILLEGVECKTANIIKQEMLSVGGDAAVSRACVACSMPKTDVVIIGSIKQIGKFAEKLSCQPFGLGSLAEELNSLLANVAKRELIVKTARRELKLGTRPLIMGIINVTPDSFSDGGVHFETGAAVERALRMVEEGADIIDVGGESSRPGAEPVSVEEELRRVIPVIDALGKKTKIPLSIDTTKARVAKEAVASGAEIINDISALRFDVAMGEVAAQERAAIILMHMRGTPRNMQLGDLGYGSVCGEIVDFLRERLAKAKEYGLDEAAIMIDPGIGFGKTSEDNLRIIRHLEEFRVLGRPIVLGTSRKSFIGKVTGGEPDERIEGTAASVAVAVMNGVSILRVHDVGPMKKVILMTEAICKA